MKGFDTLNEEDFKKLRSEMGINWVRLGVMWESVETSPGNYNQTYLDVMNDLVTRMGESMNV